MTVWLMFCYRKMRPRVLSGTVKQLLKSVSTNLRVKFYEKGIECVSLMERQRFLRTDENIIDEEQAGVQMNAVSRSNFENCRNFENQPFVNQGNQYLFTGLYSAAAPNRIGFQIRNYSTKEYYPLLSEEDIELMRDVNEEVYLLKEQGSSEKLEFIDGEIIAMARAEPNHVAIVSQLAFKIVNGLTNKECEVFVADLSLKVERNYFYPDIQIYCLKPNWVFNIETGKVSGTNPTVIIEISSESTWKADVQKKVDNYLKIASLQEYIALHSISTFCIKYSKQGGSFKYEIYKSVDDILVLKSIGFTISLGDIYKFAKYPKFFC